MPTSNVAHAAAPLELIFLHLNLIYLIYLIFRPQPTSIGPVPTDHRGAASHVFRHQQKYPNDCLSDDMPIFEATLACRQGGGLYRI